MHARTFCGPLQCLDLVKRIIYGLDKILGRDSQTQDTALWWVTRRVIFFLVWGTWQQRTRIRKTKGFLRSLCMHLFGIWRHHIHTARHTSNRRVPENNKRETSIKRRRCVTQKFANTHPWIQPFWRLFLSRFITWFRQTDAHRRQEADSFTQSVATFGVGSN